MTDWKIGTIAEAGTLTPERLEFMKKVGLNCLQLVEVTAEFLDDQAKSDALVARLNGMGLPPVSLFLSFFHDWDIPGTFGFTVKENRPSRTIQAYRQMDWAKRYGITDILCHAGHFPAPDTPEWTDIVNDVRPVVEYAQKCGQRFLFESGPESAEVLKILFRNLNLPNVGLNLDPANFITYDSDKPAHVEQELFHMIGGMHCKDAVPAGEGEARGHQVRIGEGVTDFANLLEDLLRRGYRGPLIIEREIAPGPEQEKDIADCLALLHRTIEKVVGQQIL